MDLNKNLTNIREQKITTIITKYDLKNIPPRQKIISFPIFLLFSLIIIILFFKFLSIYKIY